MFRVDLTKGCGDLIYSSHILIAMTAILAVNYYIPILVSNHRCCRKFYLFAMYAFFLPLMCLLVLFVIAARKHYTVDVVVALYTTPLVFYASFYFIKDIEASNYLTQRRFPQITLHLNNRSIYH